MRYDTEADVHDTNNSHTKVLELVGWKRRVLELGCATGRLSRVLRERGCEVVGIEIDPDAAKLASEVCDAVIVGDIEQLDLAVELGAQQFDVIVAADVLEHLRDPAEVLTQLRQFLAPGGYVVVSAPNVAHGSVRLALLQGSFPYSDLGLLDDSHLRFYTRASLVDMIEQSGFDVVHIDDVVVPLTTSEVPFDADAVPPEVLAELERDPDALVYQFVTVAFPAVTPANAIPQLVERLSRRLAELERSHAESERLRDLAGQAEQLASANEELQLRLLDAHDVLVRTQHEHETLITRSDAIFEESSRRAQVITDLEQYVANLTTELEGQRSVAENARARLDAVEEDARTIHAALEDAETRNTVHVRRLEESESRLQEIYSSRLWRTATRYRRLVQGVRVMRDR